MVTPEIHTLLSSEQDVLFSFRQNIMILMKISKLVLCHKSGGLGGDSSIRVMNAGGLRWKRRGLTMKWETGPSAHLKWATIDTRPGLCVLFKCQYPSERDGWTISEHYREQEIPPSQSIIASSSNYTDLITALWKMLLVKIMVSLRMNA